MIQLLGYINWSKWSKYYTHELIEDVEHWDTEK